MDLKETNSDYEMKKDNLQIFTFKKCFKILLFLEIVSVTKIKNKLLRCMCKRWWEFQFLKDMN